MSGLTSRMRRVLGRGERQRAPGAGPSTSPDAEVVPVDIAPNDPIVAYFQSASGAVDLESLDLESPAKENLREAGVKLVVPLVAQGELIGLLNLGPRRSERDYSGDDRKLLDNLAAHAAPAVRVAQLVKQQEAEVRTRERLEQELRVAQLIQQQFLPKELPDLPEWHISAYYQPARAVGGDFYDFIDLEDGKVGIVVGDVTDKGVPAALVMATTHSILRGDGPRLVSPSAVLERANDLLFPDIPAHMFVTCFYAVLDPRSGVIRYANAGHNLPYVRTDDGVIDMHATGMPLGLMPKMKYEEKEMVLEPGQTILFHSDGLVEAHSPDKEMFGFDKMKDVMKARLAGQEVIDRFLKELSDHTGPGWEQEDDITLVTLERASEHGRSHAEPETTRREVDELTTFTLPSETGRERDAMTRIAEVVAPLGLSEARLDKLKTAVAEATMNAIEHGNGNDPSVPVKVRVTASSEEVAVFITDQGGGGEAYEPETPDLKAKLSGEQSPRGWGLFLIKNMVDGMDVTSNGSDHTVKLVMLREGAPDGS